MPADGYRYLSLKCREFHSLADEAWKGREPGVCVVQPRSCVRALVRDGLEQNGVFQRTKSRPADRLFLTRTGVSENAEMSARIQKLRLGEYACWRALIGRPSWKVARVEPQGAVAA